MLLWVVRARCGVPGILTGTRLFYEGMRDRVRTDDGEPSK